MGMVRLGHRRSDGWQHLPLRDLRLDRAAIKRAAGVEMASADDVNANREV
jgi:hypothetical protein